jgi:large subunit ribosomal protein L35
MPKLKSRRGLLKRIRLLRNGRVKRGVANKRHILTKKSPKRKRQLRGLGVISKNDVSLFRRMLNKNSIR